MIEWQNVHLTPIEAYRTMTAKNAAPKKRKALTHGVTPPAQVKHLSGLEFIQGMLEGRFPRAPIMAALNIKLRNDLFIEGLLFLKLS